LYLLHSKHEIADLPFVHHCMLTVCHRRWIDADTQCNAEGKDTVHVPVYLNAERASLVCSVHLEGEGGGGGGGGGGSADSIPFYEMGAAITLWSDL